MDAGTQIYIRKTHPDDRRWDVFQAEIGYATRPEKISAITSSFPPRFTVATWGSSAIQIRCEALRDYFYAGDRHRVSGRQPSLYELLRVDRKAFPAELRLAFKLRTLELRTAQALHSNLPALGRAFNILARPELRACYDALLDDLCLPQSFPYGGFGSLLAAGDISRDGSTFYASRILAFLPEHESKHFECSLRKIVFYNDHATYRDLRRKLRSTFRPSILAVVVGFELEPVEASAGRQDRRKGDLSFKAANINTALERGIWRSGKPLFRAASKSHFPQTLLNRSPTLVRPITTLVNLPKPLIGFVSASIRDRSNEPICRSSASDWACRATSMSRELPGRHYDNLLQTPLRAFS